MNFNVTRYRMLENILNEHKVYEMFFAHRPICSIDTTTFVKGVELEHRASLARTGIDRARFLAKHDRSKYMPHIGNKQRSCKDDRRICGTESHTGWYHNELPYKPEDNT